jgi:argininosuccinate lyase
VASDATPGRSLGGRFTEATHPLLERINHSLPTDRRMWAQDVRGSKAHATMLAEVGLITAEERDAILTGLEAVAHEIGGGTFPFLPSDEDIHMAVERRLGELVGAPAKKLHTGRSRNDQVALDVLLWLRDEGAVLRARLRAWLDALLDRAAEGVDVPMPSFTHSQPAQVASVGAWLLAHAAEVHRHLRRLDDWLARLDESPLGSGASAGTYLPLDRRHTAATLGFAAPSPSSIASTGSRADLLDAVGLLALIGTSVSRLGEELVLYATPTYGFVRLPDRLTTGSSLLPQKRNPDGAELLRSLGKLGAADFAALAAICGGLVSGYSKDLQADKEILFRAWDRTADVVELATLHVREMAWSAERLAAACSPELAALWLADRLVLAGLPFREAHHVVGRVVRLGEGDLVRGLDAVLADTAVPDAAAVRAELVAATPASLLAGLRTEGGAGPASVRAAIRRLRG